MLAHCAGKTSSRASQNVRRSLVNVATVVGLVVRGSGAHRGLGRSRLVDGLLRLDDGRGRGAFEASSGDLRGS